ncbi:hypothetical protein [Massilia rhizosphaerae]|uniref:hypothetical protein n=1 Tax=Massilia rhizosphaerae TaxID=2784389 RepID=UPI0018DB9864|nr:hypothetical protein [Massilia rhizosphaerae]
MINSFETLAFYRGISSQTSIEHPSVRNVRKDRIPRNMPQEIHDRADAWFNEKFGVRYRSQALFVTSSMFIATNYATTPENVVRVIPIGPYRYCWSKKCSDLLFFKASENKITIEGYLNDSDYIETDLADAFSSGNEVMLYCEQYVAIPLRLLQTKESETAAKEKSVLILA